MKQSVRLVTAVSLVSVFGFVGLASAAGAETATGSFGNELSEVKNWTLVGTGACTDASTGTWSVDWTLTLDGNDGLGVVVTSSGSSSGTNSGFASPEAPSLTTSGSTSGITTGSVTETISFNLPPDGLPYFVDTNENGIQDENEPQSGELPMPAGAVPVPGSSFPAQTVTLTVQKPEACAPAAPVDDPADEPVATSVTPTAAPTNPPLAQDVSAGNLLPTTGASTNTFAILAAVVLMTGIAFVTGTGSVARRRPN